MSQAPFREMTNTPPSQPRVAKKPARSSFPLSRQSHTPNDPSTTAAAIALPSKQLMSEPRSIATSKLSKSSQTSKGSRHLDEVGILCKALQAPNQHWTELRDRLQEVNKLIHNGKVDGDGLVRLAMPLAALLQGNLSQLSLLACTCIQEACVENAAISRDAFLQFSSKLIEPLCTLSCSLASGSKQASEAAALCLRDLFILNPTMDINMVMEIIGTSKNNVGRRQACNLVFALACQKEEDRDEALASAITKFLVDTDGETRSAARQSLGALMHKRDVDWIEFHVIDSLRGVDAAQVTLKQFALEFPLLGKALNLETVAMRPSFAAQQRLSLQRTKDEASNSFIGNESAFVSPVSSPVKKSNNNEMMTTPKRVTDVKEKETVASSPYGELLLKAKYARRLNKDFDVIAKNEVAPTEPTTPLFVTPAVVATPEDNEEVMPSAAKKDDDNEEEEDEDQPLWPGTEDIMPIALNFKEPVPVPVVPTTATKSQTWPRRRIKTWVKTLVSVVAIAATYIYHHRRDLLDGTCEDFTLTAVIPALVDSLVMEQMAPVVVVEEEIPYVAIEAEQDELVVEQIEPVVEEEQEVATIEDDLPVVTEEEVPVAQVEEEVPVITEEEEVPVITEEEEMPGVISEVQIVSITMDAEEEAQMTQLIASVEEKMPVTSWKAPVVEEAEDEPVVVQRIMELIIDEEAEVEPQQQAKPLSVFFPLLAALATLTYLVFRPSAEEDNGFNTSYSFAQEDDEDVPTVTTGRFGAIEMVTDRNGNVHPTRVVRSSRIVHPDTISVQNFAGRPNVTVLTPKKH